MSTALRAQQQRIMDLLLAHTAKAEFSADNSDAIDLDPTQSKAPETQETSVEAAWWEVPIIEVEDDYALEPAEKEVLRQIQEVAFESQAVRCHLTQPHRNGSCRKIGSKWAIGLRDTTWRNLPQSDLIMIPTLVLISLRWLAWKSL